MEKQPHPAQVVMMSAYAQYKEEARNKKAHLFLIKPFENIFHTFDQTLKDLNPPSELSFIVNTSKIIAGQFKGQKLHTFFQSSPH